MTLVNVGPFCFRRRSVFAPFWGQWTSKPFGARHHIRRAQRGEDRIRCWTSCTSTSMRKVWKLPSRLAWSMLTILAPWLPRMPAIAAERARLVRDDDRTGAPCRRPNSSPQARSTQSASIPLGERVAADHVDLDPLALAAQADDAVAGDRVAAFGEVEGDARGQALDRDGGALRRRLDAVLAGRARHQRLHHRDVADPLQRDRLHQRGIVVEMEPLAAPRRSPPSRAAAGRRWTISSKILRPSATVSSRSFDLTKRRIFGARLAGDDEAQPGRLRVLRLGRRGSRPGRHCRAACAAASPGR